MTPIAHFEAVWLRCAELSAIHAYLAKNLSGVLSPDEILRAEWVTRVSALDLYVHELVAQRMLEIFNGTRAPTPAYLRFEVSTEALHRIRAATTNSVAASAAFDLEVRERLSRTTYQFPDDIADGVRQCSPAELWNDVVTHLGATPATKAADAKFLRQQLTLVVRRRNQIAHEGDLQPNTRIPWPIAQADLVHVADVIERIVRSIDAIA